MRGMKRCLLSILALFLSTVATIDAACTKRMLAYYGYYDQYNSPAYTDANIPYAKLTHIIEDNLNLDCTKADGSLDLANGAGYADTNLITSMHNAGGKVLMEVANDFARPCTADTFSTVAANAAYRTAFADNIYNFCTTYGYDGVDIDWEVPATAADGANCTLMMQAIRARMPPPWIVSMAIPALPASWTTYNVPALIGSLDWINVMTYDFNEGISNYTALVSPELQSPADTQSLGSLKTAIDWYDAQGVPLSKLNAGMAFYGYYYPNATAPWQNCTSCDPVYEFYGTYIKPKINAGGWTDNIETASDSRYLASASPSGFITYDSASSIADKVTYSLATRGIGGVFMWELSEDYDGTSQDLLTSMYNAFSAQCGSGATATSTPTFTPTKTGTATNTATWTNTQTATFTVTSTNIPSKTPVNTFTNTPGATATWTPTRTNTTVSSPASTSTAAPTLTGTQTFTRTQTPALTSTCTATATPAGTKTSSETVTAVLTYTYTSTVTYTETNIITGTATDTTTNTGTFTTTLTPVWTMTPTATASFSASFIPSETPSAVSTATATFTATPSFTAALTNSSTAVFSATDTASFTFTPTMAVTLTPTAGEGDKLEIKDTLLYPNPDYGFLDKGVRVRFSLTKDADTLKFILYTVNFRKVRETEFAAGDISGGMKRGGNEAPIDGKYFNNLANGSYYYFLQAKNYQGESARSVIKPLIIIH